MGGDQEQGGEGGDQEITWKGESGSKRKQLFTKEVKRQLAFLQRD